jgi:hypothetical protein
VAALCLVSVDLASGRAAAQPAAERLTAGRSEVELLGAGASPQRPLRHRFERGLEGRYRLRIDMQMRVQAGARDQSVDMPVLVLDLDLGPGRVVDGNLRFGFRLVDTELEGGDERAREGLGAQLTALEGTGGSAEVDPEGRLVDFSYDLPEDAPPELQARAGTLRESIANLLPRFPSEPVGEGATWRIRDTMSMPGMQVEIATLYRLRRWDGDRVELQVRLETAREPATEAMQMTVDGSGRVRFVLGTLQTRSRLRSEAQVSAQGPNGAMRIEMSSRNEVEPRP